MRRFGVCSIDFGALLLPSGSRLKKRIGELSQEDRALSPGITRQTNPCQNPALKLAKLPQVPLESIFELFDGSAFRRTRLGTE